MSKKWEKVYSALSLQQVEIMRIMLGQNDIPAVVVNKQDSMYVMLGEVELHVQQDNVMRAINLIEKADL